MELREIRTWTTKDSRRALQRGGLVERLLPHQRRGARRSHPLGAGRPVRGPLRPHARPAAPRARHAAADALLRHPPQPRAGAVRLLRQRHPRVRLPRTLPRRLPDQGQPAAPGGRGAGALRPALRPGPRGRLQARAAGGARAARQPGRAPRAQRLQGRRVHRDGAARAEAGALPDRGHRPLPRAGPAAAGRAAAGHPAAHRRARQAHHEGRRQVGGVHRRPLQVRAHRHRDRDAPRQAARASRCSTASSCCTSTSARRSPPSAPSRTPCGRPAASTSSWPGRARGSSTSTWAAAWAWTTTARQTNLPSSTNYTMQEYANDVVAAIQDACERAQRGAPRHHHRVGPRAGRAPLGAGLQHPGRERGAGRPGSPPERGQGRARR